MISPYLEHLNKQNSELIANRSRSCLSQGMNLNNEKNLNVKRKNIKNSCLPNVEINKQIQRIKSSDLFLIGTHSQKIESLKKKSHYETTDSKKGSSHSKEIKKKVKNLKEEKNYFKKMKRILKNTLDEINNGGEVNVYSTYDDQSISRGTNKSHRSNRSNISNKSKISDNYKTENSCDSSFMFYSTSNRNRSEITELKNDKSPNISKDKKEEQISNKFLKDLPKIRNINAKIKELIKEKKITQLIYLSRSKKKIKANSHSVEDESLKRLGVPTELMTQRPKKTNFISELERKKALALAPYETVRKAKQNARYVKGKDFHSPTTAAERQVQNILTQNKKETQPNPQKYPNLSTNNASKHNEDASNPTNSTEITELPSIVGNQQNGKKSNSIQ